MANSGLPGWRPPAPTSWLGRLAERLGRSPDEVEVAVRVLSGSLDGEGRRWRRRRSWIDPLVVDGVVGLNHGHTALRLRIDPDSRRHERGLPTGHAAWHAVEVGSGAEIQVALAVADVHRIGLGVRP